MNAQNLFFHIHYCNSRQHHQPIKQKSKFTRTLQHHELILFTGGKGSITVEKKKYQVKEGMLFYICPGLPHFFERYRQEQIYFLSVHFSCTKVIFNDGQWDTGDEVKVLPMQRGQELTDYYQVEDIFKKLLDCWNANQPGYEFVARTYLQQLLIEIFQNTRKQNRNYATSLKVEKIIKYMHQNINSKLTLTELAEMVQLSPFYLSRTFKNTTGYSMIEYFNKIKVDKAKELILEGDKKVKEVANALGFVDEFYFSRIFKRIEGISPSEYYDKNVHGV